MLKPSNSVGQIGAEQEDLLTAVPKELQPEYEQAKEKLEWSAIPEEVIDQVLNPDGLSVLTYERLLARINSNGKIAQIFNHEGKATALDLEHIDKGGMAAVRIGWHIESRTFVAMKVSFCTSEDVPTFTQGAGNNDSKEVPGTAIMDADEIIDLDDEEELNSGNQSADLSISIAGEPGDTGEMSMNEVFSDSYESGSTDSSLGFTLHSGATTLHKHLEQFTAGLDITVNIDTRFEREIAAYEQMEGMGYVDKGFFEGHKVLMMEYAEGARSLKDLLRSYTNENLSPEVVKTIVLPLLKALQQIHDYGVVHRDIKDSNVLIDENGYMRIIDFGLAKNYGVDLDRANRKKAITQITDGTMRGDFESTQAQARLIGTPAHMAPELFASGIPPQVANQYKDVIVLPRDNRIDTFLMGSMVYHLLTRQYIQDGFETEEEESGKKESRIEKQFRLMADPKTFESKEFKALLENVEDEDVRNFLQNTLRFDPNERKSLRELAKPLFKSSVFAREYGGDFERWWTDKTQNAFASYAAVDPEARVAENINAAAEQNRLRDYEKQLTIPARRVGRYVLQNRALVASVLTISAVVGTPIVWGIRSHNQAERVEQAAKTSEAVKDNLITVLRSRVKPTNGQLDIAISNYNKTIHEAPQLAKAFKEEIYSVANVAFIIEFDGMYIKKIVPRIDPELEASIANIKEQLSNLDGSAQSLDLIDPEFLRQNFDHIKYLQYSPSIQEFKILTSSLLDDAYEIDDTLSLIHKVELKDTLALEDAFTNLQNLLLTEDGPHTDRCQRQLQVVNALIANWQHRTATLNNIEDVGVESLPKFIDHDYDDESADLVLSNKVEEREDGSTVLHSRFGSFRMVDNCIDSLEIDEMVPAKFAMRFYEDGTDYADADIAVFMYEKDVIKPFMQLVDDDLKKELATSYFYFSFYANVSNSIYFQCKYTQGMYRINLDKMQIDYLKTLDDIGFEELRVFNDYLSRDYSNYSTRVPSYSELDQALPEAIRVLSRYCGQYPLLQGKPMTEGNYPIDAAQKTLEEEQGRSPENDFTP